MTPKCCYAFALTAIPDNAPRVLGDASVLKAAAPIYGSAKARAPLRHCSRPKPSGAQRRPSRGAMFVFRKPLTAGQTAPTAE
jgi:hypothetical protein